MRIIRLVAVILLLSTVLFLVLTSCGSSLKGDKSVGSWKMVSVQYMNQLVSTAQLKETGAIDKAPTMSINEDGSCTIKFMDASGEGKVSLSKDETYELVFDNKDNNNESVTYNFEIDKKEQLRLDDSDNGMILIFEKKK